MKTKIILVLAYISCIGLAACGVANEMNQNSSNAISTLNKVTTIRANTIASEGGPW